VFTEASRQIEGSGLRLVTVQVPVRPPVYHGGSSDGEYLPPIVDGELEDVLLAYSGAYSDGTFEAGVWLGRVIEEEGVVEWEEVIAPGDEEEPPGRGHGVLLASPTIPDGAVLFGGETSEGLANDLWSFDLQSRSWRLLSQTCEAGLCPPLVRNAVLVFDEESHRTRVALGRSDEPYDDPTWSFASGEGWTSGSTFARDRSRDCDGDGAPEPDHGVLCQATDDWWAPLGAFRCASSGLACSALETEGGVTRRIRAPGARELAAVGPALLVLQPGRLEAYDASEPWSPVLVSSVRLRGRARVLEVGPGRYGFVAAGRAVEVVDLSDPLAPEVVGRLALRRKPKGLAFVGPATLVAATRDGLAVIDVSEPESPELVSFLWLQRSRAGWEAQLGDWRRPPRRWKCGGRGPRPLAASGTLVVAAAQGYLLVVDVSDPREPELRSTLALDGPAWSLRVSDRQVYVAWADREVMIGPVIDITDPSAPVEVGEHEVAEWVRGVLWRGDWAYRPHAGGVEIARVGR